MKKLLALFFLALLTKNSFAADEFLLRSPSNFSMTTVLALVFLIVILVILVYMLFKKFNKK